MEGKNILYSALYPDNCGTHTTSYSTITESFLGVKATEHLSHSSIFSAEVKNAWSYVSIASCVFLAQMFEL